MHIQFTNRLQAIETLPIPAEVKNFLRALDAPGRLRTLFNEPNAFYDQGWPETPGSWTDFADRVLLPLWKSGEQIFAADVSQAPTEYIAFYLEIPREYRSFGHSIYTSLFHMLSLHVWEYGGGKQEISEAAELAKKLNFPYFEELEKLLHDPCCTDQLIDEYLGKIS